MTETTEPRWIYSNATERWSPATRGGKTASELREFVTRGGMHAYPGAITDGRRILATLDTEPKPQEMRARDLVDAHGLDLISKSVITEAIGGWPGGVATVTEIQPDPAAPEIVFQVRSDEHGEMGVFDHEMVTLVEPAAKDAPVPVADGEPRCPGCGGETEATVVTLPKLRQDGFRRYCSPCSRFLRPCGCGTRAETDDNFVVDRACPAHATPTAKEACCYLATNDPEEHEAMMEYRQQTEHFLMSCCACKGDTKCIGHYGNRRLWTDKLAALDAKKDKPMEAKQAEPTCRCPKPLRRIFDTDTHESYCPLDRRTHRQTPVQPDDGGDVTHRFGAVALELPFLGEGVSAKGIVTPSDGWTQRQIDGATNMTERAKSDKPYHRTWNADEALKYREQWAALKAGEVVVREGVIVEPPC